MEKIIKLCGKYRKIIYAILTVAVILLICFPVRNTVFKSSFNYGVSDYNPAFPSSEITKTPFCFASFYWLIDVSRYESFAEAGTQFFYLQMFSFLFLTAFIISGVFFWVREVQNKKNCFILPLLCSFISHILLSNEYVFNEDLSIALKFFVTPSTIIFIILIFVYTALSVFLRIYARNYKYYTSKSLSLYEMIDLLGTYKKWIYGIFTVILLFFLCFPIQTPYLINANRPDGNYIRLPFFIYLSTCISRFSEINTMPQPEKIIFAFDIASFVVFIILLVMLVAFLIFNAKNKKFTFFILLFPALIIYILQGFYIAYHSETRPNGAFETITTTYWNLSFEMPGMAILFIILIFLYALTWLFVKLYPYVQPRITEVVNNIADKVHSHQSKSQRIDELERQNEEMRRRLENLENKENNK